MELILLLVFLLAWGAALLGITGILPLAGSFDLGLYEYYALAALLGWLAGNVFIYRSRAASGSARVGLGLVYLMGPPGLLYLVRALASLSVQVAAPMAAVYAWGVFLLLFLVPVSFRNRGA